jgi:hypothetical protein
VRYRRRPVGTEAVGIFSTAGFIGKGAANRFDAKPPRSRQFGNSKMPFAFGISVAAIVPLKKDAGGGIATCGTLQNAEQARWLDAESTGLCLFDAYF